METLGITLSTLVLIWLPFVQSQSYYVISAPSQMRPGGTFNVAVTYFDLDHINPTLNVTARVTGSPFNAPKKLYYSTLGKATVNRGSTVTVPIKIGNWNPGNYQLTVTGSSEPYTFQRTINLDLSLETSYLFIQTSQGIYQAGQTVKFRVISTDMDLFPYANQILNVYVRDVYGSLIKQWNEEVPSTGIFQAELPLSSDPVLGKWSIEAQLQGTSDQVNFDVVQYDFPTFQVVLTAPTQVSQEDTTFPITITSTYPEGQPVKGSYALNVTLPCAGTLLGQPCKDPSLVITGEIFGSVTVYNISKGNLDFGQGTTAKVTASVLVTDEFTGVTESDSQYFKVLQHYPQISMDAPYTFSRQLPIIATIRLRYPDGNPVLNPSSGEVFIDNNQDNFPFDFTQDGSAQVVIPPQNLTRFVLWAQSKELNDALHICVDDNIIGGQYIYIDAKVNDPQVGDEVEITVQSTFPMENYLSYQVAGRNDILLAQTIVLDEPTNQSSFNLALTMDMSPMASVVVFYLTHDGYVIGDALSIYVEGALQTPLTLSLNSDEFEPGDVVTIDIQSDPFTTVALMAIDQTVYLLNKGNDLTKDKIYHKLDDRYSRSSTAGTVHYRSDQKSLNETFQQVGILLDSDSSFYDPIKCFFGPIGPLVPYIPNGIDYPQSTPRTKFPNTWIWVTNTTDDTGAAQLSLQVPNTMTTWLITGFAINSKTGLGLAQNTLDLSVSRPFFIRVNFPYSVVLNEIVYLQVVVYNYVQLNQSTEVQVTVSQKAGLTSDFRFVDVDTGYEDVTSYTGTISINSDDVQVVTILIEPLTVGAIDLQISAVSPFATDVTSIQINTIAEGFTRHDDVAVLINMENRTSFTTTIDIDLSCDVIDYSMLVEFVGMGNIMAIVIENLNALIALPTGCGEQNMVNFIPNVVIFIYLERIERLTEDIRTKIIRYVQIGYQRELTFRLSDGSFRVFTKKGAVGSLWLTAFVLKGFNLAYSLITVDLKVLESAEKYIIDRQHVDGSFSTADSPFVHNIMGDTNSNQIALTAFVVIAFLETPRNNMSVYQRKIALSVQYIEKQLKNVNNALDITIVTYALQLANSKYRHQAFSKMNEFATTTGDLMYWEYPTPDNIGPGFEYMSYSVEATGYGLLVHTRRGERPERQLPIVRWLVSQRNSAGGFPSTQNTVIGIQALAEASPNFVGPPGSFVSVDITYQDGQAHFDFDHSNEFDIQKKQLSSDVCQVDVTATGTGIAIAQVSWTYNVDVDTIEDCNFDLDIQIETVDSLEYYHLNVCASYVGGGATSMVVMQLNTLSGYTWSQLPHEDSHEKLKLVEIKGGQTQAHLYFTQIPQQPHDICVQLTAARQVIVRNLQDANIYIYDYYQTDIEEVDAYNLPTRNSCNMQEITSEE